MPWNVATIRYDFAHNYSFHSSWFKLWICPFPGIKRYLNFRRTAIVFECGEHFSRPGHFKRDESENFEGLARSISHIGRSTSGWSTTCGQRWSILDRRQSVSSHLWCIRTADWIDLCVDVSVFTVRTVKSSGTRRAHVVFQYCHAPRHRRHCRCSPTKQPKSVTNWTLSCHSRPAPSEIMFYGQPKTTRNLHRKL